MQAKEIQVGEYYHILGVYGTDDKVFGRKVLTIFHSSEFPDYLVIDFEDNIMLKVHKDMYLTWRNGGWYL